MKSATDKIVLFTAPDIAELIGGNVKHVLVVMKACHDKCMSSAFAWLIAGGGNGKWPLEDVDVRGDTLVDRLTADLCASARITHATPDSAFDGAPLSRSAQIQAVQTVYLQESNFDKRQFHRSEIARWLKAVDMDSLYDFGPTLAPTPLVQEPDREPHSSQWKMRVQVEAADRWKALDAAGASPTLSSIADLMAVWCRKNQVRSASGIYPQANYLRTHVLGAKHWSPPI